MLPDPLHPALVHFPIVLALLAPLLMAGFLWAIHTRRLPARAWLAVVVLQAAVFGSAWITAEAGEDQEDRVERVVREEPIEEHEEAAEWFIWIAGLTLPIAGAGLLAGGFGTGARGLALAGSLLAALAVARTGQTGGDLVYVHGAATIYLDAQTTGEVIARSAIGKLLSGELDLSGEGESSSGPGHGQRNRED